MHMNTLSRRDFFKTTAALSATGLLTGIAPAAETPVKFKVGLVSYMVSSAWDLATTLRVCKAVGVAAVECRTTHKHGIEPSLSSDDRKKIKAQFADSGVVFWGCGSTCEFHDPDSAKVKKQIEDCKSFIKLVADLGGKGVKVRPNGLPKGVEVAKTLEQIGKALIECGRVAEESGVEIWVEVHGGGTQDPPNMKTIMEQCGHKSVGLTWNSNPTDVKNGSVAESFALLKPWIKSCHINNLENDAKKVYPYRELFKLLKEANYDRYTLCEVGKSYPDPAEGEAFLKKYVEMWSELVK
jgi:sugar phosphate isomerase/epimerase